MIKKDFMNEDLKSQRRIEDIQYHTAISESDVIRIDRTNKN